MVVTCISARIYVSKNKYGSLIRTLMYFYLQRSNHSQIVSHKLQRLGPKLEFGIRVTTFISKTKTSLRDRQTDGRTDRQTWSDRTRSDHATSCRCRLLL